MVANAKVLYGAILVCVLVGKSCSLEIDYLGDYLTDEEYRNREICSTKVCMEDNDRLVYAATRNSSIKPCEDIKTFAAGEFLKHRVLNDRYIYIGFQNDVNRLNKERQRIILKQKIKDDEPRMFKIMKNFFKKCIDSDLIRKRGGDDMIAHLQQFGGSPLVTNGSWSENGFETKNLFNFEPYHAMFVFLDQKLDRCKDPRNPGVKMLCFKSEQGWRFSKLVENDTIAILKPLKLDKSSKQTGIADFIDFLNLKNPIQPCKCEGKKPDTKPEVFTVRELSVQFPELNLDWLNIINKQLLKQTHLSEEDEIVVENPELLRNLLTLLAGLEPRKIANIFTTTYFYSRKETFIVYSFSKRDASKRGTKQSYQRFEQCIYYLESTMRSAIEALAAEKYYKPSLQAAGRELIMDAFDDVVEKVKGAEEIDVEAKTKLLAKLESINIIAMYPDDILNATKIQEMYEELTVDGSEPLVDLYLAIGKHNRKLYNSDPTSWMKFLQRTLSNYHLTYDEIQNVMFVPSRSFLYPFFHPERSRFFNTITLYKETVQGLNKGISRYLIKETNKTFLIENAILADENYVRWEANGGKERQLSAFKLTNRQMLWVCSAYRYTSKYHEKVPKTYDAAPRLQIDYLHVRYKHIKNFREAFQCGNLTDHENLLFKEFKSKNLKLKATTFKATLNSV